jgi:hypothetical protein
MWVLVKMPLTPLTALMPAWLLMACRDCFDHHFEGIAMREHNRRSRMLLPRMKARLHHSWNRLNPFG